MKCVECGEVFDAVRSPRGASRSGVSTYQVACPQCSTIAKFVSIDEVLEIEEETGSHAQKEGKTSLVRLMRRARSVAVDVCEETVRTSIDGERSVGESSAQRAAENLRKRLNQEGANWVELQDLSNVGSRQEQGIDFEATDATDANRKLRIQVTRAFRWQGFWRNLSQQGHAEYSRTADAAADDVRAAIMHKIESREVPRAQRAEMVLALDATEAAGHAMEDVAVSFRQRHRQWAAGLGLDGIWLVGLSVSLTVRLA